MHTHPRWHPLVVYHDICSHAHFKYITRILSLRCERFRVATCNPLSIILFVDFAFDSHCVFIILSYLVLMRLLPPLMERDLRPSSLEIESFVMSVAGSCASQKCYRRVSSGDRNTDETLPKFF